jgi:hypothetical protein
MSLIPEKRVDKNGRLVTRRVRSSSFTKPPVNVPPPHLSQIDPSYYPMTTPEQLAFFEALTVSSSWIVGSSTHEKELEMWRKDIPHVSQKIIDAALPVLTRHASTRCVITTVQNLVNNRSLAENVDDLCTQIRLAAVESYYEHSLKFFDQSRVRWVALSHVFAVTGQDIDEDTPDEEQVNKIVALAHVLTSASVAGLKGIDLRDADFKMGLDEHTDLVRITLAQPDRAEEIAAFISERGVADAKLVQEFLSNEAPALIGGVL